MGFPLLNFFIFAWPQPLTFDMYFSDDIFKWIIVGRPNQKVSHSSGLLWNELDEQLSLSCVTQSDDKLENPTVGMGLPASKHPLSSIDSTGDAAEQIEMSTNHLQKGECFSGQIEIACADVS